MEREPEFWEDYLQDEPFCRTLKRYWWLIAWELRFKQALFPNARLFVGKDFKWMNEYPNRKVKDPITGKSVKMYENTWEAMPWSLVDDLYRPEVDRIVRKLKAGETVESLIKKYRWIGAPIIHNIVKGPEKKGILRNVFLSKLSPGSIIRPHNGLSNDYMRVHLGLQCDPGCKITVGDVTKTWEDGKILAFKDGGPYPHSVVHNGKRDRYIMAFDLRLDYVEPYLKWQRK